MYWYLALGLATLIAGGAVLADYWSALPADAEAQFVGRQSCVDCHREQAAAYRGSDHDRAMDLATEESVEGDFSGVELEHYGITSRMFRRGDDFMVRTEGPDGQIEDFRVKYVFGVRPLQQYMVEFDRTAEMPESEVARLQVLRISWDTERKRWFYLSPPDVDEKLDPHDDLHWTGIAQRWQTMCAECHSTNLQRNYDTQTGHYHTTFSEIDVSCEACHGPGSLHVQLAHSRSLFWDRNHGYGLTKLKGDDPQPQLQTCAPCHSRRAVVGEGFLPGSPYHDHYALELLRPETYFPDGQIKDEDYVFGSFIQSRMYHKSIRCTDCHDPHSLKLKHPGNATCTSCHQHPAGKYDTPSHHHHTPGTPGAACVDCHMPERTYMEVDERRDHSLRIPRPDLSVKLGTPNACTGCHAADHLQRVDPELRPKLKDYEDWQQLAEAGNEQIRTILEETDRWSDQACDAWYGESRRRDPHFAEALVAHRRGESGSVAGLLRLATMSDELAPAIARATALDELVGSADPSAASTARQLLEDPSQHPLVRAAAVRVFTGRPPEQIQRVLVPRLDDPSRLVRTEAARLLADAAIYQRLSGVQRQRLDTVLDEEVHGGLMAASDRAGAHMGWALLCEQRGRLEEAVQAYETAIRVEPRATGPRTNLAALLEAMAQQGMQTGAMTPTAAEQLTERAAQLRRQELPLMERDATLAPNNAAVQYRYGLALYLAGQPQAALVQLQKAVDLEPENPLFRQALQLLKEKLEEQ